MLPKMVWTVYLVSAVNSLVLGLVGTDTKLSPSLNALVELMTLTENTCGKLEWCTVKTDVATATRMSGCCVRCSCDQGCEKSKSCCPDFKLGQLLEGLMFKNIADFEIAIRNETLSNYFQDDTNDDDLKEADDQNRIECLNARLFDVSPIRPKSSMYFMLSKCPDTTISREIKRKCEIPYVNQKRAQIEDFIPLQSTSSGVVYRNRYCMLCNDAENDTFTEWEVYITALSRPTELLTKKYFSSMAEVFTYIFQQYPSWAKYEIVFEPGEQFRKTHPPLHCHNFDFQTCKSDNMTKLAKRDACKKYVLPAYVQIDRKFTAFKNLACLSCNGHNLDNRKTCSTYGMWAGVEPFLGRVKKEFLPRRRIHRHKPDMETIFSSRCDSGHVYDSRVDACRKIYCPCGMVVHKGKCVSIIGEIYNKFYSVHVNIAPSQVRGLNIKEFQKALFQYLNHSFENNDKFFAEHIVLMASKGKRPDRFFAYLIFSGQYKDSLLPDAIYFVAKHFLGFKNIEMEHITTTVKMAVTDTMQVFRWTTKDITTGVEYKVVLSTSDVFTDNRLVYINVIPLSECSFCHRIELLDDEMQLSEGKLAVFIKPSQLIDVGFTSIESNGTGILVCAAKVMVNVDTETPAANGKDFDDTDEDQAVSKDSGIGNTGTGISNTGMLFTWVFSVLLLCVIVTIKLCLKRFFTSSN